MMRFKNAIFAVLIFTPALPLTDGAQAGVDFFRRTCIATLKDFTALETRLLALKMKETNDLPSRILGDPKSTRTWTSHTFPGNPGDGFVQLAIGKVGQPFEVCSHVSRPGENATEALTELQLLYPPAEGSVRRGTDRFYGGQETWAAKIGDVEVFFRVGWASLNFPSSGTSELSLIKPKLRLNGGANGPIAINNGSVHLSPLQEKPLVAMIAPAVSR
jgi:hypothetical protein